MKQNKFTHKITKKQRKADREWLDGHRKVMTLEEAAKKLNNDEVYRRASRGIPSKDLNDRRS